MKSVPIETVIDIYDPSILWCNLAPQYPGYQISNTGLVRSMKFFKKYPYGVLIAPDKNGKVKLSNSLNQVKQVDITCINEKYFNIPTIYTDVFSRNPIATSRSDYMKNKIDYKKELQKPSGFHFKTID